jgi:opacity protein-like surface antigen
VSIHGSTAGLRLRRGLYALAAGLAVVTTLDSGIALGAEPETDRWHVRLDVGGSIPETAELTESSGLADGGTLSLNPGFQFDVAGEYQITPWLGLGPEIGFTMNFIDSVGDLTAPDGYLYQILLMGNAVVRYPRDEPVELMVGVGGGGVGSFLNFGNYYYGGTAYGWSSWTSGSDFVPGFQAFAGIHFQITKSSTLGVMYRYLQTGSARWTVDWYGGQEITLGVDSIRVHSVCLVLSTSF